MASKVTIRQATLADVAALAKIHVDTWRTTYSGLIAQDHLDSLSYEEKEQDWKTGIQLNSAHSQRLVAELDGQIAGFVIVGRKAEDQWPQTAAMYALYVTPSKQGLGVGSLLFSHGADWLRAEGHSGFLINVLKGNEGSIRFYERKSARLIGEMQVTLGGKEYPELIYEYVLAAA